MPSPRYETQVREAVAADDMAAALDALVRSHAASSGYLGAVWGEMLALARDLPLDTRERLAGVCAAAYPTAGGMSQSAMLVLVATIAPAMPVLVEERRAALELLADRHGYLDAAVFAPILAKAELTAGRTLSPPVIAVFRRAATGPYASDDVLAIAEQCPEPVLNVGERWADRALADLTVLAPEWHDLVAFARTAKAAKPSAKWEKTGRELLAAVESFEDTVVRWLTLVGKPRTLPLRPTENEHDVNASFDPFNANALRGLVWLLAFSPPRATTARALGTLAETSLREVDGLGPGNPKVANAAVYALSRLTGDEAQGELARLAATVTFKGTLKVIDAALAAKAESLGRTREQVDGPVASA